MVKKKKTLTSRIESAARYTDEKIEELREKRKKLNRNVRRIKKAVIPAATVAYEEFEEIRRPTSSFLQKASKGVVEGTKTDIFNPRVREVDTILTNLAIARQPLTERILTQLAVSYPEFNRNEIIRRYNFKLKGLYVPRQVPKEFKSKDLWTQRPTKGLTKGEKISYRKSSGKLPRLF